jgi:RNA polymerase sigma-54 factor
MPYRISQDPSLKGKQTQSQRFILSEWMQHALKVLQLPLAELSQKMEEEIDQNPLLEREEINDDEEVEVEEKGVEEEELRFSEDDFSVLTRIDDEFSDLTLEAPIAPRTRETDERSAFLEASLTDTPSLYETLIRQAADTFNTEEELQAAEILIGYIDDHGFLTTPLKEIAADQKLSVKELEKALAEIQTFDPAGVGAKNLQESFLIQLRRLKKKKSLAYLIVEKHFDDLVHNHIPALQKKLKVPLETLNDEIHRVIAKLDKHPGLSFTKDPTRFIAPDIKVEERDGVLEVVVNHDPLPPLRLNNQYLKMLKDPELPKETRAFIEEKLKSAKWLMRIIDQRESTLTKIVKDLIRRDKDYFLEPGGKLKPLTMKTVADEIGVHESTVARAVQNKYLSCARGIIPLRSFFNSTFHADDGEEISASTIKELIKNLIEQEEPSAPLSDEKITEIIRAKGIVCARRTVAKFRSELNLGNRHQRRKF